MSLTPIKVRGRRKRRAVQDKTSDDKSNNNAGATANAAPRRPRGRPMMSFAEKSNSQSRAALRARPPENIKPIKRQRGLSRLECLPVELIEKIFLYSLEVNLPRASPVLAAALSRERIYRVFILLSFWDDSPAESNKSVAAISRIMRPLDYMPLEEEQRRALQSAVLRCRWCTVHRIVAHLPDLMNLTIQKHWFGAGITMDETQRDALNRFLERKHDGRTFEGTNENKNQCTMSIVPLLSVSISRPETDKRQTHRVLSLKTFPARLLRGDGGFSDDDIASLELLRTAHGFENSGTDVSFSRDDLQQGVHVALVENNPRALTTLLKIDEYFTRGRTAIPTRNHAANGATDLQYSIPAEYFRTAVRLAGHDPTLLQILLRANAESLPPDDWEITQWAMDLDSAFGRWLLDFMCQLPQQIEAARSDPRGAGVFYMGRANREVEMGRRYLDEVLGVAELPSWMEETSFDVSSQWKVVEEE
ncbi:hypothetical protein M432DRAFT_620145 [Thermoascus aurantiacus ATCC 26904]